MGHPLVDALQKRAVPRRSVDPRDALDAIRRAFTPGEGCLPDCDSAIAEFADCSCGYVEAGEDVAEYARRVLREAQRGA